MSTAVVQTPLNVRPARDSRPPARMWRPELSPAPVAQPMLDLGPDHTPARPNVVRAQWMATPPPDLPDPAAWCVSLARLVIETLQGLRPIGQLNRWVDEQVLAAISRYQRQRSTRTSGPRPARPAVLESVHVQLPVPLAVEASAHLRLGRRSIAMAFRLEAYYDRWLCTAVEIGPRHPPD